MASHANQGCKLSHFGTALSTTSITQKRGGAPDDAPCRIGLSAERLDAPMKSAKTDLLGGRRQVNRFRAGRNQRCVRANQDPVEADRRACRRGIDSPAVAAFRRVPICRVHLRSVARRHVEIVAAGVCAVVVFTARPRTCCPTKVTCHFRCGIEPK